MQNKKFLLGLFVVLLSTLACEPVFAIGWEELLLLFILFAILLGPPLYRFIRRLEEFLKHEKKSKS
jgi:hypothetical protein